MDDEVPASAAGAGTEATAGCAGVSVTMGAGAIFSGHGVGAEAVGAIVILYPPAGRSVPTASGRSASVVGAMGGPMIELPEVGPS